MVIIKRYVMFDFEYICQLAVIYIVFSLGFKMYDKYMFGSYSKNKDKNKH